jgi:GTP-binding protein EngB required for normal cell division
MNLNETPSGERLHIGFFGSRNAGKSSVVNAVTGQESLCRLREKPAPPRTRCTRRWSCCRWGR